MCVCVCVCVCVCAFFWLPDARPGKLGEFVAKGKLLIFVSSKTGAQVPTY